MDNSSAVEALSSITVGQIIAWFSVLTAIITAICTGTIKMYKLFTKYREAKDRNEKQDEIIKSHDATLKEIDATLQVIRKSLEEQKDVNLKQVRHTIVHTCEDALDRGEISINKLRSLEEMYEEYTDVFHGNGYVKTLVEKVRQLKVVGKLDD
jgi:hypothetical protein